jgi:hypothetical protein
MELLAGFDPFLLADHQQVEIGIRPAAVASPGSEHHQRLHIAAAGELLQTLAHSLFGQSRA